MNNIIQRHPVFFLGMAFYVCCVFAAILVDYNFLDELFAFMAFGAMLNGYFMSNEKIPRNVKIFIIFTLVYFLYSCILGYNTRIAIILDVIQEIKPYIAFWGIYYSYLLFSSNTIDSLKKIFSPVILIILVMCLFFGTEMVPWIFTGHPSGYGGFCLVASLSYLYFSNRQKKDYIIMFIILTLGLLSERSKFYGEYCLALYLFIFVKDKIRFNLKTIISCILLIIITIIATWEKFSLYILNAINGVGEDSIARNALYYKCINVCSDTHYLGAGFASYGSFSSGLYYSPLYEKYNLSDIYGLSVDYPNFIADTYYPSLIGQFGIPGIILFISFLYFVLKKIDYNYSISGNIDNYKISIIFLGTLLIESIAGPLMLTNVGVFIMFAFAMVLSNVKPDY